MVRRVKLESDMAAEVRDLWREAQEAQVRPGLLPTVGFELEDNYIFVPMIDRGEFIAGVLYAFGEDLSEADEAMAEEHLDEDDEE